MIINYKNINRLKKFNFLKIKKNNNNKKILLIDRGQVEGAVFNSLCSVLLNKRYNYNIDLLINYLGKNNPILKIYESFEIDNFININIKRNYKNFMLLLKTFLIFFKTNFNILVNQKGWFVNNFTMYDILFGDIIFDDYNRNNLNFLKKNLYNKEFQKILIVSIYKIIFLNNLISKNKYKYILASSHTYASNSSIGIRIALKKGINVINILSSRLRIYTKLKQAYQSEFHLDKHFLNNKKIFNSNWNKKFDIMIKNRHKGKIKFFTAKDAYEGKISLNKDKSTISKLINSNNFQRIVFYAPHCFSDANHSYGKFIFDSYFDQFEKTLKIAKEDTSSLWIVKIHPTSYLYNEQNVIKNYIKNINMNKNIIICPQKLRPNSIITIADLVITGRGTIGLESAIVGKKPLLAGENFYSNCGITFDPINQKKYFDFILKKKLKTKLNIQQIKLAKKLFYLLVFKNSHIKKDKIKRSNYIEINSKNKIDQDFFDQNTFLKKISYQLKDKINLMNDRIIKNYDKEISKYIHK